MDCFWEEGDENKEDRRKENGRKRNKGKEQAKWYWFKLYNRMSSSVNKVAYVNQGLRWIKSSNPFFKFIDVIV